MKRCAWPGCQQNATEGEYDYYHAKVAAGMITMTRGEYGRDIHKIKTTLSPAAEEKARKERELIFNEALRREAEREAADGFKHLG